MGWAGLPAAPAPHPFLTLASQGSAARTGSEPRVPPSFLPFLPPRASRACAGGCLPAPRPVGLEPSGKPGAGLGQEAAPTEGVLAPYPGCCRLLLRPSIPSPSSGLKWPGLGTAPPHPAGGVPGVHTPCQGRAGPRAQACLHKDPGASVRTSGPRRHVCDGPWDARSDSPRGRGTTSAAPPTFPQLRQWCFLRMTVKGALHAVQKPQASSGTHSGGSMTTTGGDTSARGTRAVAAVGTGDWGGGRRLAAVQEPLVGQPAPNSPPPVLPEARYRLRFQETDGVPWTGQSLQLSAVLIDRTPAAACTSPQDSGHGQGASTRTTLSRPAPSLAGPLGKNGGWEMKKSAPSVDPSVNQPRPPQLQGCSQVPEERPRGWPWPLPTPVQPGSCLWACPMSLLQEITGEASGPLLWNLGGTVCVGAGRSHLARGDMPFLPPQT